jgi:hypothetical protein
MGMARTDLRSSVLISGSIFLGSLERKKKKFNRGSTPMNADGPPGATVSGQYYDLGVTLISNVVTCDTKSDIELVGT